jgi:hypothetical protein
MAKNPLAIPTVLRPLLIRLQLLPTTRSAQRCSKYQAIKARRGGLGDGRVRPPRGWGFRGRGLPRSPNEVRHLYRNKQKNSKRKLFSAFEAAK